MTFVRSLPPILMILAMAACSKLDGLKDGKKSGDSAAAGAPTATDSSIDPGGKKPKVTSDGEDGDSVSGAAAELDSPGLPTGCTARPLDGKLCISCKPRELPITSCGDSELESFNPDNQCSHDLDQLVCDFGGPEYFRFDLEAMSPLEKIYERVPLIIFGAKLLLASKLETQPEVQETLNEILDVLGKHRLTFFTCGDIGPVIAEVGAIAQKFNPQYTPEQINAYETHAQLGATLFQNACKAGQISDANLIQTAESFFKALPPGLGDSFGGGISLSAVLAMLQSHGGNLDSLAGILGGKDLASILSGIQTGAATSTSTGTGTSTSTGTGTSTATSTSTSSGTSTETGTSTEV